MPTQVSPTIVLPMPAEGARAAGDSRRAFLTKVASTVFAGMVAEAAPLAGRAGAATGDGVPLPPPPFRIAASADEDVLVRMQRDLQRALEKPLAERRWGMVIDTRKCIGCDACTVGCTLENKLPPGVVYRPVVDMEVGTYPNVTRRFLPRPCMHCEHPPCVPVCPVGATWKRADGIVAIDYDACIGCRYCIPACPYQARTFDFGADWTDDADGGRPGALALASAGGYEREPSFEYGREWTRGDGIVPEGPVGTARKCTFCAHRLDAGMLPMCVTTCIGRATFFGDLDDPESIVSELSVAANASRLKDELGTEPKVYYLV
jgi:Fe-S-cluster-containing dehydrogenase component